jgi:hypothetical protein
MLCAYVAATRSLVDSIRLICKQRLIEFYSSCGFSLIGASKVHHGHDQWFDMVLFTSTNNKQQ